MNMLPRNQKQSLKKKRFSVPLPKISLHHFNIGIVCLIVVAGMSYLIQINGLATKGYQISELEDKVAELKEFNSDLQMETLRLQSMGSIKDKVASLEMVAVDNVEYLSDAPVAVAK